MYHLRSRHVLDQRPGIVCCLPRRDQSRQQRPDIVPAMPARDVPTEHWPDQLPCLPREPFRIRIVEIPATDRAQCGKYSTSTRATRCGSCPSGETGPMGSNSAANCSATPAGEYSDSNGCAAACPAGTYSSSSSATSCTNCTSNTYSSSNSSSCSTCATGTAPNSGHSTCTATSTAAMRRRDQATMAQNLFCLPGYTSCPIPGFTTRKSAPGWNPGFECINTASDVESCGGCVGGLGSTGVDCTLFDPLARASCQQGVCHYSCPKGYDLTKTGCIRQSGKTTSPYTRHARSTGRSGL